MLNSCCTLTMVSVSSIADQLCKQKLEDGWSNSEPENKKSVLSFPGCLVSKTDTCEAKAKASKSLNVGKEPKFNNNMWASEANEIEAGVSIDTGWYHGQIEQMPPKKKHCRSFSMPRESKSESGSGFRKVQHSQLSLSSDILRPVAVRPCFALGLHSASKADKVVALHSACEDVLESNLNSDNSYPISGPCSDFYDYSIADSVVVDLFQSELCQSRVAYGKKAEVGSGTTLQCTTSCVSDIWRSANGVTSAGNEFLLRSPYASLIRSRSTSSALSNIDLGNLCQGSYTTNPCQLQTPERKTGLKRRRDEDRPKLDFFKMIETAYENDLFSSSISKQMGSRRFSKEDVSLSSVNQAQSVESSSPCPQLDSNNPCRISPASPFISLHRHFLAEKVETAATGDDDAVRFNSRDAAINYGDQSQQKNWMNRTHNDLLSEDNHVVRNQVVGSEFDLDLIENN